MKLRYKILKQGRRRGGTEGRSGSAAALLKFQLGLAPRPSSTAEPPLPPRPAQRDTTPSRPPRPANLQMQLLEKAGEEPRKSARVHGVEQRHGPADAGRKEGGSEGPWPHCSPALWRDLLCSAPLRTARPCPAWQERRRRSAGTCRSPARWAPPWLSRRPAPDGGLAEPSAAAPLAARAARTRRIME